MRSQKLFQILETGITKAGPYFSNNAHLLIPKNKLPKANLATRHSPHSPVPEEASINVSSENSFEEQLPGIRGRSPRPAAEGENDFSYIKTDYAHICMLPHDEFLGVEWNLAEIEESASIVFGDETDFKDLFFNLENF